MKRKANLFALVIATLFSFSAIAQNVTGIVSDAKTGEPLPSVSIKEKGTSNAAITNFEGRYSIKAGDNAVLIFSSMGYASNEVSVTGKTLNVSLKKKSSGVARQKMDGSAAMDDGELDEIVITAYGISRDRKSLGYAVEEVGGTDIKNSGETNMISGISAKVSGVQVTNSSGASGAASYIKIRGNATFTSNDNQPLMVVDGVPIDNQQIATEALTAGVAYSNRAIDINPDDIESLSVLKGGAAAALYGTRGANGVILITTKKGQYNQGFKVSFNSSLELTRINKMPELQNKYAQGWAGSYGGGTTSGTSWGPALTNLGYDADGNITQDSSLVVGQWGVTPYDNMANFFEQGLRMNNSVTVSGGGAKSSYFLSVSNLRDDGVVPLNTFDRTTVRLTGSGQIASNLKATGSLAYTNSAGQRIQQGSNLSGLMLGLLRTPPSFDNSAGYENPDGSQRNYRSGVGYDNPFWTVNKNPFNDNVNRLFGYTSLEWSPLDNLLVKYRYGIDQYSDVRKQIMAMESRDTPDGAIRDEAYTVREQNHDLTANYNTEFGDIGLNVLAGLNSNQRDYKSIYTYGTGLVLPDFYNMSNALTQFAYESNSGRRLWGIYAEAQLDYKNWAFLTLTGRRDQASTFGNVGTPIIYPSASLAVVLTDALDIKSDLLSMLKVRASTAQVGSEPPFASNATYFNQGLVQSGWINGISFPYLGAAAFTQSNTLGNPDLRPEYTSTNEFGVELGLFKNKINADVAVYQQTSNDLIVAVPVAGSSGFTNTFVNAGTMTNNGVEIALSANAVRTDDFNLDFGLTYTRNRNEVTKLAEGVPVVSLPNGFSGANQRLVEGEAYGTLYGSDWERNDDGDVLVGANGFPLLSATEVVIGDPNPDYLLGFNTTASYKNWTFNMLWDIRQGGDIWNGTRGALHYFGAHAETDVSPDGTARGETFVWTDHINGNSGVYAPGSLDADGNDISGQVNTTEIVLDETSYALNVLSGFTGASRVFIEDGSWVRLRNIGVSYEFDKGFAEKLNLKGLTIGVNARNLFLSTPYRGVDPETNLSGAANSQGADYFNMPNTSGVIFNLKANF